MFWWPSLKEYIAALLRAYQSFVLGLVFGIAGAAGLFLSNQSGVRIAALIGVALGFLVAPYQAFKRMRQERDIARSDSQLNRLGIQSGYVNALSGGGWAIDSFEARGIPGLIARALTAAPYPLARSTEISSADMDRLRDGVASSPLAEWLKRNSRLSALLRGGALRDVFSRSGLSPRAPARQGAPHARRGRHATG